MQISAKGELVHSTPCIDATMVNDLEGGYDERLRERIEVVLLGWFTPPASKNSWGWLKFSVLPAENFTGKYCCSWMLCWCFSCRLVLSQCSRLEALNKVIRLLRESWTCNFLLSLKFLALRKWMQAAHDGWCPPWVSKEKCSRLEFATVLCQKFPLI